LIIFDADFQCPADETNKLNDLIAMAFNKDTEFCLAQIEELETILQKASERLAELKQYLHAIEVPQQIENTPEFLLLEEKKEKKEEKESLPVTFLGDKIIKTIYADLKKSLRLNDRFRFQRDLFGNDSEWMDKTLNDLNSLSSLQETANYLQEHFAWNPENESVIAFKEILEKRFA
jgi:hypothetical protein